jgi:glycosyltransferase involved in cell wall biosynthesis
MTDQVNSSPIVSIGIPVYNGENYLEEAVNSLLVQSFKDFEIIICDNASTDRTEEICNAFQALDDRVKYYRNAKNLGAAGNYKKAFKLAKGKYFKWMAHDDTCSPNYLEECVKNLDAYPDVVMCFPKVVLIGKDGDTLPLIKDNTYITPTGRIISTNIQRNFMSSKPDERYSEILFKVDECYEFFGLSRRNNIEKTSQHDAFYGSDKVLLCELAVMGKLKETPNAIAYFRIHDQQSQALKDSKERAAWISPDLNYGALMSRFKCVQGYFRCIFSYSLSLSEKIKCLYILLVWLANGNNWRLLIKEKFGFDFSKVFMSS